MKFQWLCEKRFRSSQGKRRKKPVVY